MQLAVGLTQFHVFHQLHTGVKLPQAFAARCLHKLKSSSKAFKESKLFGDSHLTFSGRAHHARNVEDLMGRHPRRRNLVPFTLSGIISAGMSDLIPAMCGMHSRSGRAPAP